MRKKMTVTVIAIACVCVLLVGWGVGSASAKPAKLRVSLQPSPEAYIVWRLIDRGIAEKNDLDLEMIYFDSGGSQFEAFPANAWDIADTGGVPTLMGALRFDIYMIALSADDGYNNMIMVRPDSPILKDKGVNPKFPEVYGSPDAVKGKTLLVPIATSAHYAASGWLKAIGLSDKDVVIQNMEPGQVVAAFESGVGDMSCVWVPFSLTGLMKGWKLAADGAMTGASVPLVWVVGKKFGDENPDLIKKFMRLYFEETTKYLNELQNDKANLVKEAKKFYKDWAGIDMDEKDMGLMMDFYKMFDLQANAELLNASAGQSQAFGMMKGVAEFFAENKRLTPEERDQVLAKPFITDKFLK